MSNQTLETFQEQLVREADKFRAEQERKREEDRRIDALAMAFRS